MRRSFLALAILVIAPAYAARAQGRIITPDDYERWRSIQGATLTNDGKWAVYTIGPRVGEGDLVVRSTSGSTEYRYARGYIGRPSRTPSGWGGGGGGPVYVTSDSRFVVFNIDPPMDTVEAQRRAKTPADKQTKPSMGIMDLSNGQVTVIQRVRGFKVTKDVGAFVAYQLEPEPVKPDTTKKPDSAKTTEPKPPKDKQDGVTLVVKNLATGEETKIEKVSTYMLTDSATALVYVTSSKTGEGDGVFMKSLTGSLDAPATALASGAGRYRSVTLDRAGKQIAFLTDKAEYPKEKGLYSLYYGMLDGAASREVVPGNSVNSGMRISDNGSLNFNKGGQVVSFEIGPNPEDTLPTELVTEGAVFDLWHYKDPFIQTIQLKNPDYYKNPRYQALFWPGTGKWVKVGNDSSRQVTIAEDGSTAVAISMAPYTIQGMWGEPKLDLFVVNPTTGEWKLFRKALPQTGGNSPSPSPMVYTSEVVVSPNGKFVLLFEKKNWYSYNVATGKTVPLTTGLTTIRFDNETDDHPAPAGPWGTAGWTKDDSRVVIQDRYDLWEVDPTGVTPPRNITGGLGRRTHTTFRISRTDYFDNSVDFSKPLMLSATDQDDYDTGYWQLQPGSKSPEKIVMVPKAFRIANKAKGAEQYLVTQSTYREYPDLWIGPSLTQLTKITDANPQQSEYRWGTNQLVRFRNKEGVLLKGILTKPDGFDPNKKYPMIVVIYEKRSQGLYEYETPGGLLGGADADIPVYVSKGYIAFQPDIVYRDGHPERRTVDHRQRIRRSQTDRTHGPFVGRLSGRVHCNEDQHVPCDRLWRSCREHEQCVRRYSLG
jgi:hypothetical protein